MYQVAAEQDNPFTFPVTLKDKTEVFTMIFRFALLSAHQCFHNVNATKAACTRAIRVQCACAEKDTGKVELNGASQRLVQEGACYKPISINSL